jgi:hypothetical protein
MFQTIQVTQPKEILIPVVTIKSLISDQQINSVTMERLWHIEGSFYITRVQLEDNKSCKMKLLTQSVINETFGAKLDVLTNTFKLNLAVF